MAWSDPRILGALVYRHRGSATFAPGDPGARQVCAPARTCLDVARLQPGVYRYAAVLLDERGQSEPALSAPVRVPKPAKKRR